ncbi:ankyrin repeat domain-containing protein [Candidatus Babeliales bacterium]|nr:ankyrin repeat domain-containing protein [Candidatus Babeliales bacterium]
MKKFIRLFFVFSLALTANAMPAASSKANDNQQGRLSRALTVVSSWLPGKKSATNKKPSHADFMSAVNANDSEKVKDLFAQGYQVTYYYRDDFSGDYYPLHTAMRYQNTEMIEILLNHERIDVDERAKDNLTPLHRAVSLNNLEYIKLLLIKGAKKKRKAEGLFKSEYKEINETPVEMAKRLGRSQEMINLLEPSTPEQRLRLPGKSFESKLIEKKKSKLNQIIASSESPVLATFAEEALNKRKTELFFKAVHRGDAQAVQELIDEQDIDVNAKEKKKFYQYPTALCLAADERNIKIIEILLRQPNIIISNPNTVELSSRGGLSSPDIHTANPLMFAAFDHQLKTIKMLLNHPSMNSTIINQQDRYKKTALHFACQNQGGEEIIKLLMEKGADSSIQDTYGLTAACYAQRESYSQDIIRLLAPVAMGSIKTLVLRTSTLIDGMGIFEMAFKHDPKKPAIHENLLINAIGEENESKIKEILDLDIKQYTYERCLFFAIRNGYLTSINTLLDDKRATILSAAALYQAIESNNIEAIELLLKYGISCIDNNAYGLARMFGRPEWVIDLLKPKFLLDFLQPAKRQCTNNAQTSADSNLLLQNLLPELTYISDDNKLDDDDICSADDAPNTSSPAPTPSSSSTTSTFLTSSRKRTRTEEPEQIQTPHILEINYEPTQLHDAIKNGDMIQAIRLISRDYSVNALDSNGETPLHAAVRLAANPQYEHYNFIRDILKEENESEEELMTDLKNRHSLSERMICLLLDSGANKQLRNNRGETPADLAARLNTEATPGFVVCRKAIIDLLDPAKPWSVSAEELD